MKLDKNTKKSLLEICESKKIYLEGNILKLIDASDDEEFQNYVTDCITRDKDNRRKRLDVTKRVQSQNDDLTKWKKENERVNRQVTKALEEAETSKNDAIKAKEEAEKAKDEAEDARIEAEKAKDEAEKAKDEADASRIEALNAKAAAENDLELMQKKTQFELIGTVVKVALWVILGVGIVTTGLYVLALFTGIDTTVIGSTWTNIISILLTNAFSIIGTIMGVKYATSDKKD